MKENLKKEAMDKTMSGALARETGRQGKNLNQIWQLGMRNAQYY